MKKFIMLLLCLFTLIPGIGSAKEYVIKEYNYSINVPDNYIVATKYDIPVELTKIMNISREALRQKLFIENKNILYFYNPEDALEFSIVRTEGKAAENTRDMLYHKSRFAPADLKNDKKFMSGLPGFRFNNVSKYETSNAYYVVVDGDRDINGLTPSTQFYWTIKNGVNYHINGSSYTNNRAKMNSLMRRLADSVRYDAGVTKEAPVAKTQPAANSNNSYRGWHGGDPWISGLLCGILSGLFAGLRSLCQWLWHKFKG